MMKPYIKIPATYVDQSSGMSVHKTCEFDFDVDELLGEFLKEGPTEFFYVTIDDEVLKLKQVFYTSEQKAKKAIVDQLDQQYGGDRIDCYRRKLRAKNIKIDSSILINRLMDEGRLVIKSIII